MATPDPLLSWQATVSSQLPCLRRPFHKVLAMYSYAMVMTKTCGQTTVVDWLAKYQQRTAGAVRQQVREFCYDAADKKGDQRRDLDVTVCFPFLLAWILAWWTSDERRLPLALDATHLGQRFTVLVVSVLYRGCAIPVAWKIVRETEKGAWHPHWLALLETLRGSVPDDWFVLVAADRGLYARWLYEQIRSLGWHPFLRINQQGQYRPVDQAGFRSLTLAAPSVGWAWCGRVVCFSQRPRQLHCTLLAYQGADYDDPWLIVTDLAPEAADVAWYGLRAWIEAGFKDLKRGGWQWQQTKMTEPRRAERLWLVLAVGTLWVLSHGDCGPDAPLLAPLDHLPSTHVARLQRKGGWVQHKLSVFRTGVSNLQIALVRGELVPTGRFIPAPWPTLDQCQGRAEAAIAALVALKC